MKEFFKNIWTFLKKPAVVIWSVSMLVVIIVTLSIASVVMLTNQMDFGTQLRPYRHDVYSIRVGDGTSAQGRLQLNNFRRYEANGPVVHQAGINPATGNNIQRILDYLHDAGRTNRFAQVIGGQSYGEEVVNAARVSQSHSSLARENNNNFILITFAVPVFTVSREGNVGPFNVARYNPITTPATANTVVQSIFIPLNNVTNSFDEHTWHLRMGRSAIDVHNQYDIWFTHTFTTFGNYYGLFNLIQSLDL